MSVGVSRPSIIMIILEKLSDFEEPSPIEKIATNAVETSIKKM